MPPKKIKLAAPAKKKAANKKSKNAYQMPEPVPVGTILTDMQKQQWEIGRSIGAGGFGEIYSACKTGSTTKDDFVVKIEPHANGPLFVEMHFYMRNAKLEDIQAFAKKRSMKSFGMPHFVGNGSQDFKNIKHRFVVMPRYGENIWKLFLENGRRLPQHTVYRLAVQMLDVLEYIHKCTYVHADIKGANILLGVGKGGNAQAYLVDYGLASHYTSSADFKPDPKKMHNGTIEYTSRDAHQGVPTIRGDLEILAYNLVHWCGGSLPWEVKNLLGNPVKVQDSKEEFMRNLDVSLKTSFDDGNGPVPIGQFFKYITTLKFNDTADYVKCRKFFEDGLKSLGKSNSGDLEFKMPAANKNKGSPNKTLPAKKPTNRTRGKIQSHSISDSEEEVILPKKTINAKGTKSVKSLKRKDDDDTEVRPQKKVRGQPVAVAKTQEAKTLSDASPSLKQVSQPPIGNLTVNNSISNTSSKKKDSKKYEFNIELNVSIDAEVVINVKRKSPGKSDRTESVKKQLTNNSPSNGHSSTSRTNNDVDASKSKRDPKRTKH